MPILPGLAPYRDRDQKRVLRRLVRREEQNTGTRVGPRTGDGRCIDIRSLKGQHVTITPSLNFEKARLDGRNQQRHKYRCPAHAA